MFDIGTEVIAGIGSVFFRGFVRTEAFVWKGKRLIVVTNAENLYVVAEAKCTYARPVLVDDVVRVYGDTPEEK
jgi:hypothetical protein